MRCSIVLLPDPEGPMMAVSSPGSITRVHAAQRLDVARVDLCHAGEFDDAHELGTPTFMPACRPLPVISTRPLPYVPVSTGTIRVAAPSTISTPKPLSRSAKQRLDRHRQHVLGAVALHVDGDGRLVELACPFPGQADVHVDGRGVVLLLPALALRLGSPACAILSKRFAAQGWSGGCAGVRKPRSFSQPYSGVVAGSWPHAWSPPRSSALPSSCC